MLRRLLTLMLVAALMTQSAWAARGMLALQLADVQHAMAHWQGVAHHHHEGGEYHQDDSSESMQHRVADHTTGAPALLTVGLAAMGETRAPAAEIHLIRRALTPFLEGPLRPPRRIA